MSFCSSVFGEGHYVIKVVGDGSKSVAEFGRFLGTFAENVVDESSDF